MSSLSAVEYPTHPIAGVSLPVYKTSSSSEWSESKQLEQHYLLFPQAKIVVEYSNWLIFEKSADFSEVTCWENAAS